MYYPIGWPKHLHVPHEQETGIRYIICNRDRILFAVLTDESIGIWFCKPCVQILNHRRSQESVDCMGTNHLAEWKLDSTMLAVMTSKNHIIFYQLDVDSSRCKTLYEQRDSKTPSLQRETAELFIKESIPPLSFTESFAVCVSGGVSSLVCIRDELMVATRHGHVERMRWDGTANLDYSLDLTRIPFSVDQQLSRAVPLEDHSIYVTAIEYSPILGGFAVVLSDGRAAFLTASTSKFDPNRVQGLWAQEVTDATCAAVNHKYKLMAFGRNNAQVMVYNIDELATGALEVTQRLELSSKDFPDAANAAGSVRVMRWTPDGCAIAVAWERGGISLWSVFGALLTCSLGWDVGIHQELIHNNYFHIETMEWGAEGYQLWMGTQTRLMHYGGSGNGDLYALSPSSLLQMPFVKSALTVNPCMSNQEHVFLQGEDRLYINAGDAVVKILRPHSELLVGYEDDLVFGEVGGFVQSSASLIGNKQWIIIPIPYTYTGSNWPIRYTAIDQLGHWVAIAGRTGVAHFNLQIRKWKLFGNETQEKDFVVTGGLMWWQDCLVMGCYNILDDKDEIRLYPRDSKLDNTFVRIVRVGAQVLTLNQFRNRLIVFCSNSHISLYSLSRQEANGGPGVNISKLQDIDISSLCLHPACVVSVALTSLRSETARKASKDAESILINVCGRLIMIQRDAASVTSDTVEGYHMTRFCTPTILASCVENVWVSSRSSKDKLHLTDALWLGCGAHGLKVWLPLFPKEGENTHNFMSRRIMLPFHVHIYPLAVLFEDAVILGAENDTVLFSSDASGLSSALPFSIIERTSQVYLHHIIRQLLRRNLGFHAWEIARTCSSLPYFPHSLELLLHEVLEEEATSKEPIPDALLPRVIDFIREFPVYLQTVVQCARKTEIALWQYLFASVGNPKALFQECLDQRQLETAASYLIILQNLEPSSVSRQLATVLLDAALDHCKWELAKDLVRFLRAIDPSDVDSPPRTSVGLPSSAKYVTNLPSSPVTATEDDLSLVLGTMQVPRVRTMSVTAASKVPPSECSSTREASRSLSDSKTIPNRRKSQSKEGTVEEFFIDVILQRHTRQLLGACRLHDLGSFAAHLDIHLVTWLRKERNRAAKIDDFVATLKLLHHDFQWPYPLPPLPNAFYHHSSSRGSASSVHSDELLDAKRKPQMMELQAASRVLPGTPIGDSGYLSNSGPEGHAPSMLAFDMTGNNHTLEAHLKPRQLKDDVSLHTVEASEDSSFWGDGDPPFLDESTWNNIQLTSDLEVLTQELANKGPQQAEVQLRYLLQLMMEAGCLEYSLLISVVLRDAMAVIRTINSSRVAEHSQGVAVRLKEGLMALDHWTDQECQGYKPFMQAIRQQLAVLTKIIWSKPKSRHSSTASEVSGAAEELQSPTALSSPPPTPVEDRTDPSPRGSTHNSPVDVASSGSSTLSQAEEEEQLDSASDGKLPSPLQTNKPTASSECNIS